jgi:hypothetical protein
MSPQRVNSGTCSRLRRNPTADHHASFPMSITSFEASRIEVNNRSVVGVAMVFWGTAITAQLMQTTNISALVSPDPSTRDRGQTNKPAVSCGDVLSRPHWGIFDARRAAQPWSRISGWFSNASTSVPRPSRDLARRLFLGKDGCGADRYRGRYRHKVWITGQGSFGYHDLGRPVSNCPAISSAARHVVSRAGKGR